MKELVMQGIEALKPLVFDVKWTLGSQVLNISYSLLIQPTNYHGPSWSFATFIILYRMIVGEFIARTMKIENNQLL